MSTLAETAVNMRGILTDSDCRFVHQTRPHGLEIVLQKDNGHWRLAISRLDTDPSDAEIVACARSFSVPVGIPWTRRKQPTYRQHKQQLYHVAECSWPIAL